MYGNDDIASGEIVCLIEYGNDPYWGHIWLGIIYGLPLFICCLIMTVNSVRISKRFRYATTEEQYPVISSAINVLFYYPIFMVLCWAPLILTNILNLIGVTIQEKDGVIDICTAYGQIVTVFF